MEEPSYERSQSHYEREYKDDTSEQEDPDSRGGTFNGAEMEEELKQIRQKIESIEAQAAEHSTNSREVPNERTYIKSLRAYDKKSAFPQTPTEDQVLSPTPNRARLLSSNKNTMSARTENYKAPHLKALDNKLKSMIHEKKTRLMNNARSPLQEVHSNKSSRKSTSIQEDRATMQLSNENNFLKK